MEICVLIDHRSSNGEREKLAEQPVAGQRGGDGQKKLALKAPWMFIAMAKKTEGWKAGEGGPRGRES